ncbi:hypothetical protein GCM10025883_29400 [Mobilicoccus caccae]|uniref:Uncharacterized protein n=1 Tax=Mobilicoccus caccae TaxID=1859295 RepID=A0ABQ6ISL0_9MICO|nr:hypothetical protein GCM10025883_29400 [Mobilicoccus caccae]
MMAVSSAPTPSSCIPLLSTAMTSPPMMDPTTVPTPPLTAAPPMKTAAMASSSQPVPSNGPEAVDRATKIMPARAARIDMFIMTRKSMPLLLTPESRAALRLPPTA